MEQYRNGRSDVRLRLAIPSDGEMYQPTLDFLAKCGLTVNRPSARRYTATIPAVNGVEVVLQRTADITSKVEAGNADIGIVGCDRFQESRIEGGDTLLVMPELGFGKCELVVAVPDAWVDVESVDDLGDLSVEFRETGRELRVATKYPRLVQRFMFSRGVNYFSLVPVTGTIEAAPAMGYADVIADLTASGVTLRENRLKRLADGTVLMSQGCLVGNVRLLRSNPAGLEAAREIIERIEAHQNAADYYRVTANVEGKSDEAVAAQVLECPEAAGLAGPTVSPVFGPRNENWFSVTVYARKEHLTIVTDHFRAIGGASMTVTDADYVFHGASEAYRELLVNLGLG